MTILNLQKINLLHIYNHPDWWVSPIMFKQAGKPQTSKSPMNVAGIDAPNALPNNGWMMTTCPTKSVVPDQIGEILGYENSYFKYEKLLCTCAFSQSSQPLVMKHPHQEAPNLTMRWGTTAK